VLGNGEHESRPFDKLGGLEEELKLIQTMFLKPASFFPEGFKRPSGLLLYGPPGNGKTLMAQCLAQALHLETGQAWDFKVINGSEYMTKYVGEAEKKIKEVFDNADKKKEGGTVLFIDEIDSLAPSRDGANVTEVERRPVSVLLTNMDGFHSKGASRQMIIIAATNRREALDPALLRPGRFDYHVEIPNPKDAKAREMILNKNSGTHLPMFADVDMAKLAADTGGCSGAELANLLQKSAMRALQDELGSSASDSSRADTLRVTQAHMDETLREFTETRLTGRLPV
jgi:transitional endoplasmic reticulum ATPase